MKNSPHWKLRKYSSDGAGADKFAKSYKWKGLIKKCILFLKNFLLCWRWHRVVSFRCFNEINSNHQIVKDILLYNRLAKTRKAAQWLFCLSKSILGVSWKISAGPCNYYNRSTAFNSFMEALKTLVSLVLLHKV